VWVVPVVGRGLGGLKAGQPTGGVGGSGRGAAPDAATSA